MKTPPILDDASLKKTRGLTGVRHKTAIARESARRLAALGGTEPRLKPVPRRRPAAP
jgi:hypothetical protein